MPAETPTPVAASRIERQTVQRRPAASRQRPARARLEVIGPPLVLGALIAVFAVSSSRFATWENAQTIVNQSAIPLVLATGLTFVVLLGSIDLSLEGVMGVASISVALLVANDLNDTALGWLGVLLAVGAGLLAGVISGLVHVLLRIPSLMVTIGSWFVALGVATLLYPGRQPHVEDRHLLGLASDGWLGFSNLVYLAAGVFLVALTLQRFTGFGRALFAIGGDEAVARLSGLRVDRVKVAAFAFAGLTAGIAGVMATAKLGVGKVEAGSGQLFPTVAAVVIGGTLLTGGRGGVGQTLVGVLFLGVLANGLTLVGVDPYVKQGVEGVILIAAVAAGTWTMRSRLRVVK